MLVLDQWRTRAGGTTDAQGLWRGRGFHGDYVVTVEQGGKSYEQVFTLRAGVPAPTVRVPLAPARLVNLSTRASAGTGDATLIPGFFIAGPGSKNVLVRGVGPGLGAFGLTGTLAHPELTVRMADGTLVASNHGWDAGGDVASLAARFVQAGAFPLARGSGDCVFAGVLLPGVYTATITSLDGGTGVALVEVYDLDVGTQARLKNVAMRARVTPGTGVAISGLVIAGDNARTVLLRAVGPGLVAFGVSGTLARPALVVMSGNQPVAANSGWESSSDPAAIAAAGARAGAFALQSGRADAAVLATLPAGAWTIQVSGADGGAGVVFVEVYDLST